MRCPVCKAETQQGPHCRRCRADLGPLFRLEEQQRALAVRHLLRRDFAAAWRAYQQLASLTGARHGNHPDR